MMNSQNKANIKEMINRKNMTTGVLVIILAILVLILSVVAVEAISNATKFVYVYDDYEQKIPRKYAYVNKEKYIDANMLADFCGIEKSKSVDSVTYYANGTQATFEDGKNTAKINGIDVNLSFTPRIFKGYCLLPIDYALSLFGGVSISGDGRVMQVESMGKENIYLVASKDSIDIKYVTDISNYLDSINSKEEYIYTLVNKENAVGEDFAPSTLLEISSKYCWDDETHKMYPDAKYALEAMMQDMRASEIEDIHVTSSYRSYATQEWLFEYYIELEMEDGYSKNQAINRVLTYSARAGESEHQTGLCIDFTTESIGGVLENDFESTSASEWLRKNAWKYGFVLRFPKDKVDITEYSYESWHYRFVGIDVACIMHQAGICYEEYLAIFAN